MQTEREFSGLRQDNIHQTTEKRRDNHDCFCMEKQRLTRNGEHLCSRIRPRAGRCTNYRVGWRTAKTISDLGRVQPYCSQCKSYLQIRRIEKGIKKMIEEQKQRDRILAQTLAQESVQTLAQESVQTLAQESVQTLAQESAQTLAQESETERQESAQTNIESQTIRAIKSVMESLHSLSDKLVLYEQNRGQLMCNVAHLIEKFDQAVILLDGVPVENEFDRAKRKESVLYVQNMIARAEVLTNVRVTASSE